MNTKLVEEILFHKESYEAQLNKMFDDYFHQSIKPLFPGRWIEMNNKFMYDDKIHGCWLGLKGGVKFLSFESGADLKQVISSVQNHHADQRLDLPNRTELLEMTGLRVAPFSLSKGRPSATNGYVLYEVGKKVQGFDTDSTYLKCHGSGNALPLLRTTGKTQQEVFLRWLQLGLTPIVLKDDVAYQNLMAISQNLTIVSGIVKIEENVEVIKVLSNLVVNTLLLEDKIRADLQPYHQKMLEDTNQGHWSLWGQQDQKGKIKGNLSQKLVARDPAGDIIDGVVGIDFGTKSTVVAYQKESVDILPMRVGTGELGSSIEAYHYENPTIVAFHDLKSFIKAYQQRDGRPYTKWSDITISHTAHNALLNSKSEFFNSFLFELKQWAGNKNKKLKVVDKQGDVLDLPPFLELSDDDINPIEIYAYYLGLYINNMHNGIFLNYILSFPVTYELAIRHKIIESFYKGIKKSLPQALHEQQEHIEKLQVLQGASEPAAYAIIALEAYEFDPCDDDVVFYSVFDFGGGTTDFDFGVFREAQGAKERRYDYVIEHFGAGGDPYLGGENLLDLLVYMIVKKNKTTLLEQNIQFVLPPECKAFPGSEVLFSHSREANMNMTTFVEKLRALWENDQDKISDYEQGTIGINLVDVDANVLANVALDMDKDELIAILTDRIKRGVDNFFEKLRLTMRKYGNRLKADTKINILLAGNASKSPIVEELFQQKIAEETKNITKGQPIKDDIYQIFPPLQNKDGDVASPTGKTGVAFGLIRSRKGGKILVIDENIKKGEIDFSFYLGENRKRRFKTIISRDTNYGEWIDFIDAGVDTFELFYSSVAIVSTNKTPINDKSIAKKILPLDVVDEDALVYIRLINPTQIEYVVALESGIENEKYLGEIHPVSLGK